MATTRIPDPPADPTEPDEEQVLAELYGPANSAGVFSGDSLEGMAL